MANGSLVKYWVRKGELQPGPFYGKNVGVEVFEADDVARVVGEILKKGKFVHGYWYEDEDGQKQKALFDTAADADEELIGRNEIQEYHLVLTRAEAQRLLAMLEEETP